MRSRRPCSSRSWRMGLCRCEPSKLSWFSLPCMGLVAAPEAHTSGGAGLPHVACMAAARCIPHCMGTGIELCRRAPAAAQQPFTAALHLPSGLPQHLNKTTQAAQQPQLDDRPLQVRSQQLTGRS